VDLGLDPTQRDFGVYILFIHTIVFVTRGYLQVYHHFIPAVYIRSRLLDMVHDSLVLLVVVIGRLFWYVEVQPPFDIVRE
jgi:hypothetical protein